MKTVKYLKNGNEQVIVFKTEQEAMGFVKSIRLSFDYTFVAYVF